MFPTEVFSKSVPGTSHAYEDRVIVDVESRLYAVADGVTSSSRGSGGVAADRALVLLEALFTGDLSAAVASVQERIVELRREDASIGETTLTAVHLGESGVQVANVGDSPCYLLRDLELHLLTQADDNSQGSITQTIGYPHIVTVHSAMVEPMSGDYLILASDGVAHVLNHEVLLPLTRECITAKAVSEAIIERAENTRAKEDDDKTVIVIRFMGEADESRTHLSSGLPGSEGA